MRQITLRDIPEEVEQVVRKEAENRGMSLNKAFLSVLRRGAKHAALVEIKQRRTRSAENSVMDLTDELDAVIAELKSFSSGQTTGGFPVAQMIAEGRR
jgi:hypothetical protein